MTMYQIMTLTVKQDYLGSGIVRMSLEEFEAMQQRRKLQGL